MLIPSVLGAIVVILTDCFRCFSSIGSNPFSRRFYSPSHAWVREGQSPRMLARINTKETPLLVKKFDAAMQNANSVARDPYLAKLGPALAAVEANLSVIPELNRYQNILDNLMTSSSFGVDGSLTDKFAQTLGEAQFLVMCQDKGVALRRIPEEKNKKTPDFGATFGSQSVFFEVKTLSVVNRISWHSGSPRIFARCQHRHRGPAQTRRAHRDRNIGSPAVCQQGGTRQDHSGRRKHSA